MTFDRNSVSNDYRAKLEVFERCKDSVVADIKALLGKNDIKVSNVFGRIKGFESFFEKIERKEKDGKKLQNPFIDIEDLIGVRAVFLYIKDLDRLEEILKPTFKILSVERKSKTRPEDQFGYESDHYILGYDQVKSPQYDEQIKLLKFELQARIILMDAWDSVSHHLAYKNKEAIPTELKRIFYGLSGMFVVADSQFQLLKDQSEKSKKELQEDIRNPKQLLQQEINSDSFKAYLEYKFPDRWLKTQGLPDTDAAISILVREIKRLETYQTLSDFDKAVDSVQEYAFTIEKLERPEQGRHLVGIMRTILDLYDDKYYSRYDEFRKFPEADGDPIYQRAIKNLEHYRNIVKRRKN